MCQKFAKHFLLPLTFLTGTTSFAQNSNKENIPYTRYGIGDLLSGTNVMLRGMGYINSSYSSISSMNTENPASYANLRFTTYELGASANLSTLNVGNTSYGTGNATLSYLNVGIPVWRKKNRASVAFGVKPVSKVYYKQTYDSTFTTPSLGKTTYVYSGDGGLNYGYIGAAGKIAGFSFGANFGYMFGTVRNSSVLQQSDTFRILSSEFTRYTKMGGLYWNAGLMYDAKLSEKLKLSVGGTVNIGQNLNAWRDNYMIDFRSYGGVTDQDTAWHTDEQRGKIELPLSYTFGVNFSNDDNWLVGAEFSATQWSGFRNYGSADSVGNTMKFGIGGEYTSPNALTTKNYLQKITYRLGGYFGKDYVNLQNTQGNIYAITAGATLPFKPSLRRDSYGTGIHTAFEYGVRGSDANGLIRQSFFRFSLGVTLNNRWFDKPKYD